MPIRQHHASEGYVTSNEHDGTPVPPNEVKLGRGNAVSAQNHRGSYSDHRGGVQVSYLDGSVHFIRDNVDFKTYRSYFTRAGAETFAEP